MSKCKISKTKIVRAKTNGGDLAKQYCTVAAQEGMDTALILKKVLLMSVEDPRCKIVENHGFVLAKTYKGYNLYTQVFSIKLTSLLDVCSWLNNDIFGYDE
mgnify:CR=1 FL=1